mgnify:CR=1 FL=1
MTLPAILPIPPEQDQYVDRLIIAACPHCGGVGVLLGLYEHHGGHVDRVVFRCATKENGEWRWDSVECWKRWDAQNLGREGDVPRGF